MYTRTGPHRPPDLRPDLSRRQRCWSLQVFRLVLSRSPLCRRSDRVEVAALLSAVMLCMAALPVAGVVRAEVRDRSLAEVGSQAGDRYRVAATLVEDPVSTTLMPGDTSTTAEVVWVDSKSRQSRATVPVPTTAVRGSAVTVWTTADGGLTDPPLSTSQAGARADVAAIAALLAAMTLVWLALLGVRRGLDRSRSRAWEAAWRTYDRAEQHGT